MLRLQVETKKLLHDIQVAHRLAVGFYQRIFPLIDQITKQMEFEFWYWEPIHTHRPCTSTTQPSRNSFWNMVPLYASRHVYRKVSGGSLRTDDFAVVFSVHVDDGFNPRARRAAKVRSEPDPVTLPIGRAMLRIDLYRAVPGRSRSSFDSVWDEAGEPELGTSAWQSVHANLEGRSMELELAAFISNPEETVRMLHDGFFSDDASTIP